jgi:NAD(P)-dependent dehydrogenase (short-subunit alcohol dehydrogenase family)
LTAGEGYLPSPRLEGRTVLVTGGGRGLGQGIALGLAEAGAVVVVVSRTASELAETVERSTVPGGVRAVTWDVSDLLSLDALVAAAAGEAGQIHGVVHAAGSQHREDADAFTPDDWRRIVTIQLEVPFFLSTALHRAQVAAGISGSHVFIGSLTSSIGLPRMAAYGAAKSGVLGVMRSLSVEWARGGTRVNAIAPGYFKTRMTEALLADPAAKARIDARIPMGRLGTARDLAGVAAFLLSDASAYITGQVIAVDGGWLAA